MTTRTRARARWLPEEEDMGQLLDQMMGEIKNVRRGDVVEGVVMRADHLRRSVCKYWAESPKAQVPANEMRTDRDSTDIEPDSWVALLSRW